MKIKNRKKAAVIALAGAMVLTSLTACGGSKDGDNKDGGDHSLTMAWWGNQVRNERTQQALDAYKKESGVTVSGQFLSVGRLLE